MRALLLIALLLQAQAPAPPPGTDIYLIQLSAGLASMKTAKPTPVSTAPGYDNQPFFSADGNRLLFAFNRDGKQTDVGMFNRENGRVAQMTNTPENENSPTYLPAGIGDSGGFSVVRSELDKTQRLWRFNAAGRDPQLILTDIRPVGYHAWVDPDRVALFVLGEPNSLQLASVKTGKGEVVANGIGRSLHRIPAFAEASAGKPRSLVSFVHREPSGEHWIKQIDVDSKKIEPLTRVVEGATDRDMAWMPDGKTILMSGGTKVFSWTRGGSGWTEVFDAAPYHLGNVSRIAVSPKGDAIAIVVAEAAKKPPQRAHSARRGPRQ